MNMSMPSYSRASIPNGPVGGNDHIKYATLVIDYVFRESGISYLDRHDLAHVVDAHTETSRSDAINGGNALRAKPQSFRSLTIPLRRRPTVKKTPPTRPRRLHLSSAVATAEAYTQT